MIGAAVLLALPGGAAAQKLDSRLAAVLDCPRITDPAQRLACFDAAVTPLRQAASSGSLEARSLGPKALDGKIRATRGQGYDQMLIQLENGDRWLLKIEGNERLPKAGAAVTIKRGALGNWWVKVAGVQTFQSRFLGQPD
ncbi:hypothetical protein [Sphingomonas glaciei]|uniref:Uncharacterized protein n=1 Tax=Sphingomonas glaciei TaxID=2938948 RepID=A0ABY5MUQ6_9SPHN|nr:hypothetical protein [Sphingomonas glaciei]UUR07701.1 hypothetical protein M1K48_12315 [Sphingomonas glaciei]